MGLRQNFFFAEALQNVLQTFLAVVAAWLLRHSALKVTRMLAVYSFVDLAAKEDYTAHSFLFWGT